MEELKLALDNFDADSNELDFDMDSSDVAVMENTDSDPRITSAFLCTPGCGHTGSFNSYCC